jgi:hypothetical protein
LTYAWDSLSPGDVARVLSVLQGAAELAPVKANLPNLEAALAVAASLLTGRRLAHVAELSWTAIERWPPDERLASGLVRCSGSWGWYLPAGKPGKPKEKGIKIWEETSPTRRLWLPAPPLVEELARLCLNARGLLSNNSAPLFASAPADLELRARDMLRSEGIRRAGTTLEAVERWLFDAIRLTPGGDAALAQIATTRFEITSVTPSHYSACSQEQIEDAWWAAAGALAGGRFRRAPDPDLRERLFGSHFAPEDDVMQNLSSHLALGVAAARGVEERHNALTLHTFALCSVGLALRSANRGVLRWNGIDPDTGFLAVDDDRRADPFMVRLSWAAPVVREQLWRYQQHLRCLAEERTDVSAEIRRTAPFLPGFALTDGQLKPLTLDEIFKRACARSPEALKENFGRHYIRSKLLGRCATETLQAFVGHWNSGTEPFGFGSGLDPMLYRADLERSLPEILKKAGWRAIG